MKLIITFVIAFLILISCSINTIEGSSTIIKKKYTIINFDAIELSNFFNVEIIQSDQYKVLLECNENLYEYVNIRISGSTLIAELNGNHTFSNTTLKLKIYLPILKDVSLSGASSINFEEFHSKKIHVELSGASCVSGELFITDKMTINASGASEIILNGKVKNLELDFSGASEFEGKNFIVENDFILDASGASSISTTVNGRLNIDVSGASDVDYYGKGKLINKDISGAGSISKK
ncbi:MAG: DUF2807 domain-containing protein [Flavobacteriales bacterium]|nr:DUF2807 domain-containing protein [Flavobacteriales bacterium]